ncbi:hypothetical protein Tco_0731893 [Tanacetum coccineum]
MQVARDRQKSYADLKRKPMDFQVEDNVMLKVSPWKGVIRFGKWGKLNPRYVGPFKVLEKVGFVAYKLELSEELSRVHNTFHVSNLKKCYADEPLAVPLDGLHFDDKLQFVRWNSRRGPEFTWEHEDQFRKIYPHLFTKTAPSTVNYCCDAANVINRSIIEIDILPVSVYPIDAIDHMMSFLSAVITSRYPTTNNQLRNSSNPRQQATINDGRVTLQPVQGRQISFLREGHMSKQCTKPKRKRDDSWFRDKVLLVQAQANGQILHEKELAFLADPRIAEDAPAGVHNPDNVDNNMTNQVCELESQQAAFFEIDRLKQILSEYLKEKESLMQIVTLLKNDFKKEESRNIDREIALKKKIKELDNIVYKRDQSAQIVHMLTKPQFFYDDTTKQALGFQNPFYLKKAQQLEPKLYDGKYSIKALSICES